MPTPQSTADAISRGKDNAIAIQNRRMAALAQRAEAIAQHRKRMGFAAPPAAAVAPATALSITETVGFLLAIGDSWFDYPFFDVVKKLEDIHGYTIYSTAQAGSAVEAMAYHGGQLDNFHRKLEKVTGQGATPKAVLLSGGGNDIAGKEFGMLLNNENSSIKGWADGMVNYLINERILLAYQTIITTVTELCRPVSGGKEIPILVHGYDYPVPDGRGFLGGWLFLPGPWLRPGFEEKLLDDLATNVGLMKWIIDQFNDMLQKLVRQPEFSNVRYVDLRGTLSTAPKDDAYQVWWGNELHPTELGFEAVAEKFAAHLS